MLASTPGQGAGRWRVAGLQCRAMVFLKKKLGQLNDPRLLYHRIRFPVWLSALLEAKFKLRVSGHLKYNTLNSRNKENTKLIRQCRGRQNWHEPRAGWNLRESG